MPRGGGLGAKEGGGQAETFIQLPAGMIDGFGIGGDGETTASIWELERSLKDRCVTRPSLTSEIIVFHVFLINWCRGKVLVGRQREGGGENERWRERRVGENERWRELWRDLGKSALSLSRSLALSLSRSLALSLSS